MAVVTELATELYKIRKRRRKKKGFEANNTMVVVIGTISELNMKKGGVVKQKENNIMLAMKLETDLYEIRKKERTYTDQVQCLVLHNMAKITS